MNYNAIHLAQYLQLNFSKNINENINEEVQDAERDWHVSDFIFQLIQKVKFDFYSPKKELEVFHEEYEKKNGVNINLGSLLKNHWIRIITGQFHVAKRITNLFSILDSTENKTDFILKNEQSLLFLKALNKSKFVSHLGIKIPKKDVVELINQYKFTFPVTLSLEQLLELKFFEEDTDDNFLILKLSTNKYWKDSKGIIGAKLWNQLLHDKSYKSDNVKRLIYWHRIMSLGNGAPFHVWKYMKRSHWKLFAEACHSVLCKEKDLIRTKSEGLKWWLDFYGMDKDLEFTIPNFTYLDSQSHFDLYHQIEEFTHNFRSTDYQPSRNSIFFLTRQVLCYEAKYFYNSTYSFSMTIDLAQKSNDRPYLLLVLSDLLKSDYPSAIPFLLTNSSTIPWAMALMLRLELNYNLALNKPPEERKLIKVQEFASVWIQAFDLVLENLSYSYSKPQIDVLYDILEIIFQKSYQRFHNMDSEVSELFLQLYQNAVHMLSIFSIESQDSLRPWEKLRLYPYLLEAFFEKVEIGNWKINIHELEYFSSLKWSYYLLILQLCELNLEVGEVTPPMKERLEKISKQVIKAQVAFYKRDMSKLEIAIHNFQKKKEKKKAIKWLPESRELEQFDWNIFVKKLDENDLLDTFINSYEYDFSQLKVTSHSTIETLENSTPINKARLHFRILLLMFQSIANENFDSSNKYDLESIRVKLMDKILDLAKQNKDSIENEKTDFFHAYFEGSSGHTYGKSLLQHLFETASFFSNQKRIKLIGYFKNASLDRLLMIYNYLGSLQERKQIKEIIEKIDLKKYLTETKISSNLEKALIQATNSEAHTEIGEKILDYLENEVDYFKDFFINNKYKLFHIKAVLIFRKNKISLLEKLEIPKFKSWEEDKTKECIMRKELLKGVLFQQKEKYDEALEIFKKLKIADPHSLEYSVRLLLSQVQKFISVKTSTTEEIKEAFDQWYQYENSWKKNKPPKDYHKYLDLINYCHLVRCEHFGRNEEFDFYLNQVSSTFLMDKMILELITLNFAKRNKSLEAAEYLFKAKQYYIELEEPIPNWINQFHNNLEGYKISKQLENKFNLIVSQTPEDLVRLLPRKLVGRDRTIDGFLFQITLESANQILEKISGISSVSNEDIYNDFFVLMLNSMLRFTGWQVKDQSRGGRQGDKKTKKKRPGTGERDWVINSSSMNTLSTYEALVWRERTGFDYIKNHFEKLLKRYNPVLKTGFVITYCKGKNSSFDSNWEKYKKTVNEIYYSEKKFKLQENLIELSAEDINQGTQYFKVGKTIHGVDDNEILIYHFYLNINYAT